MATATWETERTDLSEHIRSVTDEEVAQFAEQGWTGVPGLISKELCEQILQHYKDWSGLRWDEWPEDPAEQAEFMDVVERATTGKRLFGARQDDPWMFNYVTQPRLGEAASRLLGVPAIRVISETMQIKYPKASGASKELAWHQDWPFLPIDRIEAVQLWVALRPVSADMGCMVHLTGSHVERPGGMLSYSGESAKARYPELWERYEQTEPHAMEAGDAVFHHALSWHYSFPNETDRIRWAMSSYRMSADALYTGQQNYNTDNLGLEPNKVFDHPNFPVVYDRDA